MTNLYEKFFYKYDNEAEFSPTYTALTSAYVLGYARGVVHVLDAVLTAMILRKKIPPTRRTEPEPFSSRRPAVALVTTTFSQQSKDCQNY